MDDHTEEDNIGSDDWRRHKPYGAGISRKRINFVKAGSAPATSERPAAASVTSTDISSFYLNLVLRGSKTTPGTPTAVMDASTPTTTTTSTTRDTDTDTEGELLTKVAQDTNPIPICDICSLPIHDSKTHGYTVAHQSSLPHSELPHHLDRSSQGLKYLVSRGWDPDKKVGLGKEGAEGDRVPMAVKLKPKYDTVGLGIKVKDKNKDKVKVKGVGSGSGSEAKVVKKKLDAKSARKEADREKARRKALADYLNRG